MEQKRNTPLETMSRKDAQEIALGHIKGLFEEMRERYSESLHPREELGGEKRYAIYEDIASTIVDRDLPSFEVDELVGNILNFEWHWKGRGVMKNFLEERGLKKLAKKWSPVELSNAFDKTVMLFPQSETVIKSFFSSFIDHNAKSGEYAIPRNPWLMRDLLLVKAVDFVPSEKQTIAKSWLAGYFIHGDKMVEDVFWVGDELNQDQNQAILLMMKSFGIEHDQAINIAQSVIKQFSQENSGFIMPDIEDFLKNASLFVKNGELNWNSFTEKSLVKIFDYSRKVARGWLWRMQRSEKTMFRHDERENLVAWLAESWRYEGIKEMGWEFGKHLNKMSEDDFFQKLDSHLLDGAKKLGQKLGMNTEYLNETLKYTKSSEELTEETKLTIRAEENKKQEEEMARLNKEIGEICARNAKSLEQALEILEIPGVRPE